MRTLIAALWLSYAPLLAYAASMTLDGFVDMRASRPPHDDSWLAGGLGKLRTGANDGDTDFAFAQAVLDINARLLPDLSVYASLRHDPYQRRDLDLMEASLIYRPVSTTPWRWSLKLGAFYPPVSLENTDVGWTSPWTLTPSAINTWVGEELRTLGGEGALEWRRSSGTFLLRAALYEWNDPTGVVIAYRGWALDDRPTGLFDRVRLPDALATLWHAHAPLTTPEFKEIDTRPGYYAGLAWHGAGGLDLELLRYDNLADPAARSGRGYAWATDFWSAGLKAPLEPFTLIAQAIVGETAVEPAPGDKDVTRFQSAYVLLGREFGHWRLGARAELFATDDPSSAAYALGDRFAEHGHAFTIAGSYEPAPRLRLTMEALRARSFRGQRAFLGDPPSENELQLQLNARLFLR
jgi:hypothetical protein